MNQHAPTSDLPLFSPPNPEQETVDEIHQDMEDRNRRWLTRARRELARLYEWAGRPLSTDDLWEAVGFIRSSREGSHGNLLRTWKLAS